MAMATTKTSRNRAADVGSAQDSLALPDPKLAAGFYFAISLFYFLPAFLPGQNIFVTDYLEGGYFF